MNETEKFNLFLNPASIWRPGFLFRLCWVWCWVLCFWIKKKEFRAFSKELILLWYARLGSNQRLSAPEADALSTELRAQILLRP